MAWQLNARNLYRFTVFTRFKRGERGILIMANAESLETGLQDGWTRATLLLRKDYLK